MGRLERLQKEITKNLNNGREVNDVIDGWSPNNLRRLLISPKVIIVEYHVTDSNKTKRLREIIDVEQDFKIELNKAMQDVNSYKSILSCLVNTKVGKSTRVFSSIEEVIFFGNYPEQLARLDRNLNLLVDKNKLAQGEPLNELLKARFIRLSNISIINSLDESAILELADKCKKFGSSITMLAKSSQVEGVKSYVINPHDWWRGTYLRPKDYSMDEDDSRLSNYFRENIAKLEEVKKKQEMDRKYEELVNKKQEEAKASLEEDVRASYKTLNVLCRKINDLIAMCEDIYDYTSKIDKVQWGFILSRGYIVEVTQKEIKRRKIIQSKLEMCNFSLLRGLLTEYDLDSTDIAKVSLFLTRDVKAIPSKANDYKEFNREAFERVIKWLYTNLTNNCYMAFVKFVTKSGDRDTYMTYYVDKLGVKSIIYSQDVLAFCNNNLKQNYAKKCFEVIENQQEVESTALNRVAREVECKKLLSALKEYTKS